MQANPPYPGPTPQYGQAYGQPNYAPPNGYGQPAYGQQPACGQQQPAYGQPAYGDFKSPYEGERFKPKKTVNDIFFLIFFIAQVRVMCAILDASLWDASSCWVLRPCLGWRSTHGSRREDSVAGWARIHRDPLLR